MRRAASGRPFAYVGHTADMHAVLVALALLHGVVMRGPTTPVCQAGTPCSEPAVGIVLVFSRSGTVVARSRTGTGGRYAIRLRPGIYTVQLSVRPRIGSGLQPQTITVQRLGGRRDFAIDTGIR